MLGRWNTLKADSSEFIIQVSRLIGQIVCNRVTLDVLPRGSALAAALLDHQTACEL